MSTSLSSLVNNLSHNLSDVLYNDKCTDFKSCLEYTSTKNNQLIFKCSKCNKDHNKGFDKYFMKIFANSFVIKTLINLFCC